MRTYTHMSSSIREVRKYKGKRCWRMRVAENGEWITTLESTKKRQLIDIKRKLNKGFYSKTGF